MERREFCRFLGVCAAVGCAGGLTGCARLLDWSASDTGAAVRELKPSRAVASTPASGSPTATGTPSAGATSTTASPAPSALPDLALYRGPDPARNARAAVAALGGMKRFVRKGDRVVVKPNVLTGRPPELATTTNPYVVAAVVEMAMEAGAADVVVLDRPTGAARTAFEVSGIAGRVAAAGGRVKYLSDRDFTNTRIPKGRILHAWPLVSDVFDADVFINVPIAKNHGLAGLTMSMKNLMGIMGGARGTIHQDFDQKIVDVNSLVRPHLVVLDAYRILIRNGPTGGDTADVRKPMTCIAGTDPVAVDSLATSLFNMKPGDLGYLVRAGEQGVGITDLSKVRIDRGTA
ncbi:MAG: DUF362 domain-containing protein [Coriobacteriia bacterium]|nr:DUF362 domain-containing protein [Coriobacteriia bacterium]